MFAGDMAERLAFVGGTSFGWQREGTGAGEFRRAIRHGG